jgi:hypothetical protein
MTRAGWLHGDSVFISFFCVAAIWLAEWSFAESTAVHSPERDSATKAANEFQISCRLTGDRRDTRWAS